MLKVSDVPQRNLRKKDSVRRALCAADRRDINQFLFLNQNHFGAKGEKLKWWSQINLSKRIIVHVALLELITILIGAIAIWYAVGFRNTVNTLVDRQIKALEAAREMENALANQKGFATYYFLDGDPKWLQELSNYREIFRYWLETAGRMNQH